MNAKWYEKTLETVQVPYPHILEKHILDNIPQILHNDWDKHMLGKTYMKNEMGEDGIYPSDYYSFCNKHSK